MGYNSPLAMIATFQPGRLGRKRWGRSHGTPEQRGDEAVKWVSVLLLETATCLEFRASMASPQRASLRRADSMAGVGRHQRAKDILKELIEKNSNSDATSSPARSVLESGAAAASSSKTSSELELAGRHVPPLAAARLGAGARDGSSGGGSGVVGGSVSSTTTITTATTGTSLTPSGFLTSGIAVGPNTAELLAKRAEAEAASKSSTPTPEQEVAEFTESLNRESRSKTGKLRISAATAAAAAVRLGRQSGRATRRPPGDIPADLKDKIRAHMAMGKPPRTFNPEHVPTLASRLDFVRRGLSPEERGRLVEQIDARRVNLQGGGSDTITNFLDLAIRRKGVDPAMLY